LEVVAAQPSSHIDYLADEVEAGYAPGFEGAGVELAGGDAAGRDFGLGEAFGVGGSDIPGVELALEVCDGGVGEVFSLRRRMKREPAVGPASWEQGTDLCGSCRGVAAGLRKKRWREHFPAGREVDRDRLVRSPVGRDLENGGAAESAMGDEELLAEGWMSRAARTRDLGRCGGDDDFGGDAGEVAPAGDVFRGEGEGNERGARLDDGDAELAGEVVAEVGRAHLRDREAAGGDDQRVRMQSAGGRFDLEAGVDGSAGRDGEDACAEFDGDFGFGALACEEVDDVAGGAVAEELAERFFVVGDAVLFDERDEVLRGVTGERGAGEVGVLREEVFGGGVEVGEVAAASAGDEDLFAESVGVVEEEGAAAALAGCDGGHEAGGSRAEDDYVEVADRCGQGALSFDCRARCVRPWKAWRSWKN
jgi:hypothetical protein